MAQLKLNGFEFQALFTAKGLARLDEQFLTHLNNADTGLYQQLIDYRLAGSKADLESENVTPSNYFLVNLAPHIETFLIDLFGIEPEAEALQASILSNNSVFTFKNQFVLRQAKRLMSKADALEDFHTLNLWLNKQLPELSTVKDKELMISTYASELLAHTAEYPDQITRLTHWCVKALTSPEGQSYVKDWVSFKLPKKLDYDHLVPVSKVPGDAFGRLEGPPCDHRQRDGFALTDQRMSERDVLSEVDYCVYCHKNDGDFCSKGFPVKKNQPELGLKISPIGDTLTGCPLEEKISEMHILKKEGLNIAALAMIMRDNPMCPATGHRICNDCMKACIYQKQEPVNIPEVETRVLTDVLSLPWGVEIYDLLTRWNPLRADQYVMQPYNGLKVLVMGMGPAGFTMAHHLLMAGFAVVGMDGLKIEPLDDVYINSPIRNYKSLEESLDNRVMRGFGGVAEYGITVRWDKNFLKLIYITLMRRQHFQVFGNMRLGGAITIEKAWELGFDHVTLAVGAGLPKELPIPNSLAPGMRQANDFLMALQLTGAAKESSLANLQVRLPAVVIGGGLTGVDTATEIQAYYIKQVEKTLFRYETLCKKKGVEAVRSEFKTQDLQILDEFCGHGLRVREERAKAAAENRDPDFIALIREWGGVSIVYRRSMQESPAYQRNHEELTKALEEGIYYLENLEPQGVGVDEYGYAHTLSCRSRVASDDKEVLLPARGIFVATGAKPNVAYAFEHKDDIQRERYEYPRYREENGELTRVVEHGHIKMPEYGVFTSYASERGFVSFIGDTHPVFHGSVVKAIASAKRAYPRIVKALSVSQGKPEASDYHSFSNNLDDLLNVTVESIEPISDNCSILTVNAKELARSFKAGQFYRIQNYEHLHPEDQSEAVAALGFKGKSDSLSFLIFNRGVSSQILMQSKPGEPLAIMGPAGVKTMIPAGGEHILIIGGEFALAYLLSVGPELKAEGNKITFLAVFQNEADCFMREEIKALVDHLILIPEFTDITLPEELAIDQMDQVHAIGYANLLRHVQRARHTAWKNHLKPNASFKGSVYGPMQCMLKGVCAQCLQWQIDPKTGKRTKAVYACSWQHQPMEIIDMDHMDARLSQNRMQEILTRQWYIDNIPTK